MYRSRVLQFQFWTAEKSLSQSERWSSVRFHRDGLWHPRASVSCWKGPCMSTVQDVRHGFRVYGRDPGLAVCHVRV